MPKAGLIPTVRFNLKAHDSVKDKETEVLILLVFRYNGNRLVYSTGLKVKPKYWTGNKAKLVKQYNQAYSILNDQLLELERHCKAIFQEHNYGKDINLSAFKEELSYRMGRKERPDGVISDSLTFFKFIENYIEEEKTKPNGKRGTWKKFITVFNNLKEYCKDHDRTLDFKDVNWEWRDDFVSWMYAEPRKFSANNAAKVFEVIKQFMNVSLRRKLHTNRVHLESGFGVKRVKVQSKLRLTFLELRELIKLDLSQHTRQEVVRDLFVVGCYTGLRFSDWHQIDRDQIFEDDGVELLEIVTTKTHQLVIIPILPELEVILKKYDYQLPKITVQEFNRTIKEVCKLVLADKSFVRTYNEAGQTQSEVTERWTKVSSHCARRSFASNFYELGIPPSDLMQITGHATEKQFFEYIDLDQRKQAKRFKVLVAQQGRERYLRAGG